MKAMKRIFALLLALSMVLSLAACGGGADQGNTPSGENTGTVENLGSTEPQYGGDLTVYFQEFYNDYDPSVADMRNYCLWFEPLFTVKWDMENAADVLTSEYMTMEWMDGQIADSYTFENGDLTVKIRDDVYFQDKAPYNGRQLTANDVKWSYDRLLGTGSGFDAPYECMLPWHVMLNMVESIEVTGDFEVVFHFNTDSELALNNFITQQVNIAGPEWDELTAEQKADWHYAAGTGPWILDEYVPDSHMKFVKNPNYYDHDERYPENQLPYLDSITCQIISDSTQAQTQFMTGNLDILCWGGNVLTSTEAELLEESMKEGSFVRYDYAGAPVGVGLKQTVPALSDIRVRQALQMAIDPEEIYYGYLGYEGMDLNIPGMFALNTQFSSVDSWSQELKDVYYTYDLEGAKALLAEAGYTDGFEFEVVIFGALDADLFTLAAQQLQRVGVTMKVSVVASPPEMQQTGFDHANQKSIFVSAGASRLSMVQAWYHSQGNENSLANNDPEFDAMIEAFNNCTSLEEQKKIGMEMDQYFAEQYWILQLGGAEIVSSFVSGRVGGYNGERLWKNWNSNQILARVWVTE